ncbi:MAG: carboxylesterase [Thermoanaerobaculia bacterium]
MSEPRDTAVELLPCVERDPAGETTASVIWLHGLGADGHDFPPIIPQLGLPGDHGVRFVFPHAPKIAVTLNGGLIMPAWYDIRSLDVRGQDEKGIRKSAARVEALLAREVAAGVPPERIVLAGFSQGGAVALFTGLTHADRLAGILALSTYLVLPDAIEAEAAEANRATPIFQAHGLYDPMVPLQAGVMTRDWLVEHGYETEWHEYPMAHQVALEEIRALGAWLRRVLGLEPQTGV